MKLANRLGALLVGVALGGTAPFGSAFAQSTASVTILGSLAGQTSYRGSMLGGPSAAIAVNGARYVVDFGRGWADRYYESGLAAPGGPRNGLENIRAAFLTHMHSDHVVDLSRLLLFGPLEGAGRTKPIQIYGPGPRGEAVPLSEALSEPPPVVNPAEPYPGTRRMVDQLLNGYAAALNDVIRDSGFPSPSAIFSVHDIALPKGLVPPSVDMAPDMEPIPVYADENVRVTAILVDHQPTYPAYAYRFETATGSFVITGDTAVTGNLRKLAKGADVLISEVISMKWLDEFLPEPRDARAVEASCAFTQDGEPDAAFAILQDGPHGAALQSVRVRERAESAPIPATGAALPRAHPHSAGAIRGQADHVVPGQAIPAGVGGDAAIVEPPHALAIRREPEVPAGILRHGPHQCRREAR